MSVKATRLVLSDAAALTSPRAVAFRECSLDAVRTFGVNDGHRGTRQQSSCGARVLTDFSRGSFSGYFTGVELDWILPRCIGAVGAAPWIPAENVQPFYALVDKVAAKYLYSGLRVNSLEVSSQEASFVNWVVDCVGGLESEHLSAWPSAAYDCGASPAHGDVVFTYGGVVYPMKSWRLVINNAIDESSFESSITPSNLDAQDLDVSLEVVTEWRGDTKPLHRASVDGAAGSIVISDGVNKYGFVFANLKIPDGSRSIGAQGKITQSLNLKAYRTNGTTAADNQIQITKVAV